MVMDEGQAKSNYQNGIEDVGISAWRNAAQESSISGAAEVLERASQDRLESASMADSWARRY